MVKCWTCKKWRRGADGVPFCPSIGLNLIRNDMDVDEPCKWYVKSEV